MAKEKDTTKKTKKKKTTTSKKAKASELDLEPPKEAVPPRLREKYRQEIVPKLMADFKYKNTMAVPRFKKLVLNAGLGRATQNIKVIEQATKDIAVITGQKPVPAKSKTSIAAFKLRAGLPIGVMVTLRGDRMFEFLDRLIGIAFPRIRDFRGFSDRGFDGRGNYTLGLKDQLVFPEIDYDSAEATFGMNISIITSAKTDEEGRALLTHLGFPFRKRGSSQKKVA